jgi:hypothetical protein
MVRNSAPEVGRSQTDPEGPQVASKEVIPRCILSGGFLL